MLNVKLKKSLITEHGEKLTRLEIDGDNITCADIILAGATDNINELIIRIAAVKAGISYAEILQIDAGATFKILNYLKEILGKDLEESPEEISRDSVDTVTAP